MVNENRPPPPPPWTVIENVPPPAWGPPGPGSKGGLPPWADLNVSQWRNPGVGMGGPPEGRIGGGGGHGEGYTGGMVNEGTAPPPPNPGITINQVGDAFGGPGPVDKPNSNEGDIVKFWVTHAGQLAGNQTSGEELPMNPLTGGLGMGLPLTPFSATLPPPPLPGMTIPGYGVRGVGASPGSPSGTPTVSQSPARGGGVGVPSSMPGFGGGVGGVRRLGGMSQSSIASPRPR